MDYTIASNSTAVGSGDTAPVTGTPGEFTEGNAATSTPATVLPAYQLNALVREIRNVIAGLGLTPDRNVTSQLLGAVSLLGIPTADTGAANAYTCALDASITALKPGMVVNLQNILHSNTGAATLAVTGVGAALPIQSAGGVALQGGELVAGYGAILRLNHGGTAWELIQTTGGPLPVAPAAKSQHAVNLAQSLAGATAQDLTASRAFGTTYTNTTGRAIAVMANTPVNSSSAWGLTGYVNGVPCQNAYIPGNSGAGVSISIHMLVPPGATYQIAQSTGTPTLAKWIEVR